MPVRSLSYVGEAPRARPDGRRSARPDQSRSAIASPNGGDLAGQRGRVRHRRCTVSVDAAWVITLNDPHKDAMVLAELPRADLEGALCARMGSPGLVRSRGSRRATTAAATSLACRRAATTCRFDRHPAARTARSMPFRSRTNDSNRNWKLLGDWRSERCPARLPALAPLP